MAIGELIKRVFATDPTIPADIVLAQFIQGLENDDKKEREDAQRLLDWYNRDREKIIAHLKDAARIVFGESTATWIWPIMNHVPRMIRRLSMAYKEPPRREYFTPDGKKLGSEDERVKRIERIYRGIDRNRKLKEFDRYVTLLNTAHMEIVPRSGRIDWDIRLRPSVTVIESPEDYLDFAKIAFRTTLMNPDTMRTREGWIYWSEEDYFFLEDGGAIVAIANEDTRNPYGGEIPVVTARKIETDEYWGRFGADIIEATTAENIQLADLWHTVGLQSFGVPFGTNLGLRKGERLTLSPETPLLVDKVTRDMIPPDLKFLKPDPDVATVKDLLQWYQTHNGGTYGMPASAFSEEVKELSGYAKMLDNLELIETREDEIDQWIAVEMELDRFSRLVHNTWFDEKVPSIDDVIMRPTFPAISFPEDPLVRTQRWILLVKGGAKTWVDYYIEVEGMTEEDAKAEVARQAQLRREFSGATEPPATLPDVTPQDGNAGG